jgi:hypothetical protein
MQSTPKTTNFEEFRIDRPFSSLLSTTRDVLLSPRRFFDGMPADGPLGAPVLYFLICFAITTAINLIASLAVFAMPVVLALSADSSEARPVIFVALAFALVFLVVVPILSAVVFFVSIPLQHVFVRLVAGRNQRGLPATLRVSCYSVGAPLAVAWIPLVGVLAVFYCLYLYTAGLKRVHGISTGRTLAAILILAALSLILAAGGIVYGYNLVRAATETPVSYYFPESEASEDLPPGVVGAAALMDGNEDQARVRRLREASYSDEPPPESSDKPRWIKSLSPLTSYPIQNIDRTHQKRAETLRAVDDLVAGVVSKLNSVGVMSNTYIFFTSDNGWHHGEHRINGGKCRPYEEDICVPLLVRGPGVAAGSTDYKLALNTDYLPTFTNLAGSTQNPTYVPDGRSLLPVLNRTATT